MNVYDFDNCIFRGDSTARFYLYCLARTPRMILRLPKLLWGALFVLKRNKQRFKQDMFAFLRDLKDPRESVRRFWDKNIRRIKPFYLQKKRGDDVIISASPEFLVRPAMARLGVESVMASPVDEASGLYRGKNCHGEEKLRRYREAYGQEAIDEFYSDSHSDDPMARAALSAFLVKGNRLEKWVFKR